MNINTKDCIQEDEIDLKELFNTIWAKRVFIVGFTLVVTIFSIVYTIIQTPIFEAKALIEIGDYKLDNNNNNNNKIIIDNASQLEKNSQQFL